MSIRIFWLTYLVAIIVLFTMFPSIFLMAAGAVLSYGAYCVIKYDIIQLCKETTFVWK